MFGRLIATLARIPRVAWWVAILVVVTAAAALAVQRPHMDYGDDYALYLRQSAALLDGDMDRVVADTAFLDDSRGEATDEFTPVAYPWVTSLLAVPFVRAFGPTAWDRLKLFEVCVLSAWAVAFALLMRRRVGDTAALLLTAAVSLSAWFTRSTNSVMSELPYLLVATLFLLHLDHLQRRHRPLALPWPAAWQFAALGAVVFNTRREGMAVVAAMATWQAVAAWNGRQARRSPAATEGQAVPRPGLALVARPYLALLGACLAFQLLLPSTLFPRYKGSGLGASLRHLAGPYRRELGTLLGIGHGATVVVGALLALAVVGAIALLRAHKDEPLIVFVVVSTVLAASHRAVNTRYLMLAVPFLLFFAFHGWTWLLGRWRAQPWHRWALLVPLVLGLGHAVRDTAYAARDAQRYADAGMTLLGPGTPAEDAGFDAVRQYTATDDVVAFFKGRLLSLMTDRRAVQSREPEVILREADWYLQRYDLFEPNDGTYSPFLGVPQFNDDEAAALGLVEVWRNDRWILWRIPDEIGAEP